MIKKIKSALGLKTDRELLSKMNKIGSMESKKTGVPFNSIHESQFYNRWNKKGFHKSTELLLKVLLESIDQKPRQTNPQK